MSTISENTSTATVKLDRLKMSLEQAVEKVLPIIAGLERLGMRDIERATAATPRRRPSPATKDR